MTFADALIQIMETGFLGTGSRWADYCCNYIVCSQPPLYSKQNK